MFTRNIKDTFTANLLNAVSGVLGEAKKKKCSEGCECEACTPEETKEGYMPTNDMPSEKDRKTAGKLGALLKRERDSKEKKEPNGVKTEDTDMPWAEDPNNPTRKVGERKDEYGNKVKNVAKHLAKKAMKANEEVEDLDEKRGLWDNIHAKRKRIKAGSGERMRKPGSEGAPSSQDFKDSQKESVELDDAFEQIDEISKATMGRYINKAKDSIDTASYRQGHKEAHGSSSKPLEKKLTKRHKGIETAVNKLTKEESEQIDELSKGTMGSYIKKAIPDAEHKEYWGKADRPTKGQRQYLKSAKNRRQGINKAIDKLTKEETQIDELSKDTMGRYINKAATKMGSQGVTAGLKIAADEKSSKNFKDMGKREKGIKLAVNKLTKEEQDFIDSLNDADLEQIDELSKGTLGSYIKKASGAEKPKNVMSPKNVPLTKIAAYQGDSETGHFGSRFNQATYDKAERLHKNRSQGITRAADKLAKEEVEVIDELSKDMMLKYLHSNKHKRTKAGNPRRDLVKSMRGTDMAVRKYTAKPGSKSVRVPATEEVEIGEGVTNPEIKKAYADLLKTPGGSSERKAAIRHYKSLRQNAVKEEVELDEARGRPKKAGARDFTIHPKTKEKLMHNNPEHMKRIERLQKNGILQKPKTEANQHIMQQLQRVKTSMRGGETVNFTHGDPHHVAGTHAAKLLDKYAGMKPDEKEAFQKKIGHSHANLKSEL